MPDPQRPHTVVLYAHPAPQRSPLMRALAAAARAMDGVIVRDLYETYPDFDVDGARERALLDGAGLAVFLHPFRWYGMPSLMKEWMEVVLQPGWAYGGSDDRHTGTRGGKLHGKGFWLVTSTGGGADGYGAGGLHGRPLGDFLPPYEQAAALCGMEWIDPLVVHGASGLDDASIAARVAGFRAQLQANVERFGASGEATPEARDAT